jgi:hypothetical protein
MKERPIIMTGDSVRAIIAGRKTMTRRVVKPQPHSETTRVDWNVPADGWVPWRWHPGGSYAGGHRTGDALRCPYGQPGRWHAFRDRVPTAVGYYRVRWEPHDEPRLVYLRHCGEDPSPAEPWGEWLWAEDESGDPESICLDIPDPGGILWEAPGDLLWVRETHWRNVHPDRVFVEQAAFERPDNPDRIWINGQRSKHTGDRTALIDESAAVLEYDWWVKRPSIHMPKWAARLWLRVTDVRVGRVDDITTADAIAEGFEATETNVPLGHRTYPREEFSRSWDAINGKRGFGWSVRPWVWVITFERTEAPA